MQVLVGSARGWFARTCGWGITWAVGVAVGVALGGYLTAVSGAGAPGAAAVDPIEDLVWLPAAAASVVLVVYVLGAVIVRLVRAPRS